MMSQRQAPFDTCACSSREHYLDKRKVLRSRRIWRCDGSIWVQFQKYFSGDNDSERFSIQPYQFEPRIDSDEADSIPEGGISGDESDSETTNPRLQNSDWYVSLMIVKASICSHK